MGQTVVEDLEQETKLKQEMSRRLVETQKKLSLQEAHNSKLVLLYLTSKRHIHVCTYVETARYCSNLYCIGMQILFGVKVLLQVVI